jgi:hypothetical protein
MSAKSCWWREPVLIPLLADTGIRLVSRFVDNVDAMPTPMTAWYVLRLSIKTQAYVAQTKLAHKGVLTTRTTESETRDSTLCTSVRSSTVRCEPRSLKGKNLIRSKLLLVESSLLTL